MTIGALPLVLLAGTRRRVIAELTRTGAQLHDTPNHDRTLRTHGDHAVTTCIRCTLLVRRWMLDCCKLYRSAWDTFLIRSPVR